MNDIEAAATARQTRLFVIIFAVLIAALAGGYFLFLRSDHVVLYADLRAAEAAGIVAELDRRGVDYRLGQGGTSILVPTEEADRLRVGIAGTTLPAAGGVGFELFNESSMGLTDFAQKINYQRALQGELARTIMAMDGIDTARVHLALPERALFRGNRAEPRAAVTVIPRRGQTLDEPRVLGIQRLVAASVPELALDNVTILDARGRVVSPVGSSAATTPPELGAERERYAAAIRGAVAQAAPGLSFQLELNLAPSAAALAVPTEQAEGAGYRTFNVQVAIVTATLVPAEAQARILQAIRSAAALDESAGDQLAFRVAAAAVAPTTAAQAVPPVVVTPAPDAADEGGIRSFFAAHWLTLLALIGIGAILVVGWRRSAAAWRIEREAYVGRIRQQLVQHGDAHAG